MNELRVLVITQKIDKDDDILGFFYGWLNKLAKQIDKIYVLALEKGKVDLAKNIELYSIDKESIENKIRRTLRFNQIVARLLLTRKVDAVFIHMCPEYVFLAFPYARIARIPIVMWYAHGCVDMKLKIAHLLLDKVITPSRESFRIRSNKIIITGHGIDIEKFNPAFGGTKFKIDKTNKIILSIGRISPIKNYEILIKAADILVNQRNIRDLKFKIIGGALLRSQKKYLYCLKNMVSKYKLEDYIEFVGPIPYTQIQNYYQNCDLFVSTSNTGSLDKAVLEAMACGKAVLTCNKAFSDLLKIFSHMLLFDKNKPDSLAEKIIHILEISEDKKAMINNHLRHIVLENHNVDIFINRLADIFNQVNYED